MRLFKFLWTTHKWTGIILGVVYLMVATTGFLLLIKKDYAWIQPPTLVGAEGEPQDFLPIEEVLNRAVAHGNPNFKGLADIDRIDFRLGKRLHKVRSKHGYAEIQVCAVTGTILSQSTRNSDLIEQLHDGSYFGAPIHNWLMPVVAVLLAFLVLSGVYIWLWPLLLKRQRQRRSRQKAA